MSAARRAYDALAPTYDQVFVDAGRRPWTDAYRPHLRTGLSVLDAGCGTGSDSLIAASAGCRITGVDVSAGMLAVARQRVERAGLAADFRQADLEDLGEHLPRESFDLVISGFAALNTVAKLDRFAAGVATVLRSGGLACLHFLTPGGLFDRVGHLARGRVRVALDPSVTRTREVRVGETWVTHHDYHPRWLYRTYFGHSFDWVSCCQVGFLTPDDGPSRVPHAVVSSLAHIEARMRGWQCVGAYGRFAILTLRRR